MAKESFDEKSNWVGMFVENNLIDSLEDGMSKDWEKGLAKERKKGLTEEFVEKYAEGYTEGYAIGYAVGYEKGLTEGREKEKQFVVLNSHRAGLPIETILKITGLTSTDVELILEQSQQKKK